MAVEERAENPMPFVAEIKRRNVFRVGIAYAIVGWLLVQIAATVFPILQMPEWTVAFVTMLLVLGFPVALILSWAYELTPAGIKRTKAVPLAQSVAGVTGRKLDFVIIALLSLAVVYFVLERFAFEPTAEAPAVADAVGEGEPSQPSAGDDSARDLRSIAALPFSNESAEEENAEFFANGIHDELLTRLAKIGSLKVISRTSVEEYRDATRNMREIGQALGVATLLEGRVQRAGDRVRINVQLIDAQTDEHLWAEIYDRELTASNIFAIQSEMATEIANALRVVMSPEEAVRLADVPTENTSAYDFYLSGLDYFTRIGRDESMPLAVQQYERAVEEDPVFAVAWAALSRAHTVMYLYALDRTPERLALARAAVDRALELAPDAGEPHLALAQYYHIGERDYAAALAELAIAERAMPGSAEVFELRALVLRRAGDFDASVANMERAIELDPRNITLMFRQSGAYLVLRDYAQVERLVGRILDIEPDNVQALSRRSTTPMAHRGDVASLKAFATSGRSSGAAASRDSWNVAIYERDYDSALGHLDAWDFEVDNRQGEYIPKASYYGATYLLAGQRDRSVEQFMAARTLLEEALMTMPDDARVHVSLAEALAALGESEAAVQAARRAMELLPSSTDGMVGPIIHAHVIRRVFAPLGDVETVVAELDAYASQPGWWSIEGLTADPRFDAMRDDPRFQAVVDRHRRP
jgi:TolB-like protein/Tfp pilus assembly protein PilF